MIQVAAVLWAGDTPIALSELTPIAEGWTLISALSINNAGQIAGMALRNGQRRGYLLTPTWRTVVAKVVTQGVAPAETHGVVLRVLMPHASGEWLP